LQEGVKFAGGSFGDFLAGFEGRIAVNAAGFVGHSAVRRYVMGEDAQTRAATPDEIDAMRALVRDAMASGAVGFSTSQLDIHQAHDGRPVPSNLASHDEVVALCDVLSEFDHGAIEIIPRSFADGYDDADRGLLPDLATASGKPVDLNVIVWFPNQPDGWARSMEFIDAESHNGLRLYPMYAVHRGGAYFTLDTTFLFDDMPTWREVLVQSETALSDALRDPSGRARMRAEVTGPPPPSFPLHLSMSTVGSVL